MSAAGADSSATTPRHTWPHLRGRNYDAICDNTTLDMASLRKGPPLLWKHELGDGYSGFILVKDRAYTQFQTRAGQFLACLDVRTGEILWKTRYGWPWGTLGEYPGPYATPTYNAGRLYFTGCYGIVYCADAERGSILWEQNLVRRFSLKLPGFGYACTPLVDDKRVYVFAGDIPSVVALNASDGSVAWSAGKGDIGYCSPVPVEVKGHRQIVSFLDNILLAHDPETGEELWRYQWSKGYDPHPAWPLYVEPYLFCASAFCRGSRALRLGYEDGKPTVSLAWKNRKFSHDILSSVVVNGFIYGFDIRDQQSNTAGQTRGSFKCVELATGRERWSTDQVGHASVLACGKRLVIVNETGVLIIAEATPLGYREQLRTPLLPSELCWTQPLLSDGYLIVRSQQHAACFYVGDPADLGSDPGQRVGKRPWDDAITAWLDRYQDESMWAPSVPRLAAWYLFSALGVFGLAWIGARLMLLGRSRETAALLRISLLLSLVGVPAFSRVTGVFIFTWPAGLYVLFVGVIVSYLRAARYRDIYGIIAARLSLLLFLVAMIGFYYLCRRWYVIAGYGFLVGFLFAWPLAKMTADSMVEERSLRRVYVLGLLGYSVYFWVSGLVTLWKAGMTLVEPNVLS